MKVHINQRSETELLACMQYLGHKSPSHTVQTLITQLFKSIPIVEENKSNESGTKQPS